MMVTFAATTPKKRATIRVWHPETKSTKYDIYAAHNHDFSLNFRVPVNWSVCFRQEYITLTIPPISTLRLNSQIYGKFSFPKN
ncbi:MAG: hypothetical protein IPH75_16395 [bacterium]|nr:hypothetical protein [bacterium]